MIPSSKGILASRLSHHSTKCFTMLACSHKSYHTSNVHKLHENKFLQRRLFHSTRLAKIENPYKILGVDKNASSSQIKHAYYRLAKKYHPDVNKAPNAEEKFHTIQQAYDILSDPKKKQQFDQFGSAGFGSNGQAGSSAYGGNPFGGFGGARTGNPFDGFGINLDDLFSGFAGRHGGAGSSSYGGANPFGGARSTIQHFQGEDIEVLKTISFKDAIFGTTVAVKYNSLNKCATCSGSGLKPGHKKTTCPSCHGTGSQVRILQAGFQMASTCKQCGGTGVVINHDDQCDVCHGRGVMNQRKETEVRLPQGIKDGSRIRVAGAGDSPNTTTSSGYVLTNGDLIIRVRVRPDKDFTREGNNLVYKCYIPMTTSCLGGTVEVPTLDGQIVKLRIPAGAEQDRVIAIPDKGVPYGGGRRGDEKVVVKIIPMKPTNATQTALLEALADAFGDTTAKKTDPSWKPLESMGLDQSSTNSNDKTNSDDNKSQKGHSAPERIQSFLSSAFKRIRKEFDSKNNKK